MSRKFKFPLNELTERVVLETFESVIIGISYQGKRVFTVVAKTKAEALESVKEFKENRCV